MQGTWTVGSEQGMRYVAHYVSDTGAVVRKELPNPDVQRHSVEQDGVWYHLRSIHHIPLLSEAEKRAARGVIAWR